jgi:3-oxoacyl-[acyl-carrier protein] reductase
MKKAIVLGGSRGIGKAISESLKSLEIEVISASKSDVDTSNLESVRKFSHEHNNTDILILNTGGPPVIEFNKISENDWNHYLTLD